MIERSYDLLSFCDGENDAVYTPTVLTVDMVRDNFFITNLFFLGINSMSVNKYDIAILSLVIKAMI